MTAETRNPVNIDSLLPLLPAEEEFARCLRNGEEYMIGGGSLPDKRIVGHDSGDIPNVVRGEVIRFFAYGGNQDNPVLGTEIYLQGAWISGNLILTRASMHYALFFRNCHCDAHVMMSYTECAALYLEGSRLAQGLYADGITTKGNVNLQGGFSAEGKVLLSNADIGGDLNCMGGKFHNPDGSALFADKLTTKGNVNLRDGFFAEGEVRLSNANIGGGVFCADGKFHNPGGSALFADKLTTKGNVNLNWGFFAKGEVRFSNADIVGDLNCADGRFCNPGGSALFADKLTTKGNVNLRGGFSAEGEVRLSNADIGGDLNCANGEFDNPGRSALSADKLTTKGNVNLRDGFSAEGEVLLSNANIGGDVICAGGKFHNLDGNALNVDGANVSGSLFWRDMTCKGDVNLANAKIDMLVDDLNSWKSCKVNLDRFIYGQFADSADAQSRIKWLAKRPDRIPFSPQPYEQAAKVLHAVGKDIDAWDIEREKRRLERAERDSSNLLKIPGWRRLWGRRVDALTDFVYRPWKTVMWAIAIVCLSALFFGLAAHYEEIVPHQPAILASAQYHQATLALKERKHTPIEAARAAFPVEYPEFTPLAFALDVFIPFFALHQEPFWAPASNEDDNWWKSSILLVLLLATLEIFAWLARYFRNWIRRKQDSAPGSTGAEFGMALLVSLFGFDFAAGFALVFWDFEIGLWLADWRWLTVWYWLEIIAGWILTSLFLLSATGLLRPRQSSGEKD